MSEYTAASMSTTAAMEPACGRVFVGAARFAPNAPAEHLGGFFRMLPGDTEWESLTAGLPENPQVRAVVVHPNDPAIVYAGAHDGPYRSVDGGDTWTRLGADTASGSMTDPVWCFAFDPTNPDVMFAGTGPARLHRSDDGGNTWTTVSGAVLPERLDMGFPTRLISIAIDPADPSSVFAGVEVGGVLHSPDGGVTWTDCSPGLISLTEEDPGLLDRLISDSDLEGILDSHALTVSAAAPGTVMLANRMGIFRSEDLGRTWANTNVGEHSPLTYCREVKTSPHDPNVLFATFSDEAQGVDGSLYRSADLGASWARFDGVEPASTMMKVAPHPSHAAQVWCATRDGEVFATADGGTTWTEHPLPTGGRDIYAIASG